MKSTNPIRTYILIAATVGLIIGVLLGLIYGYVINPVEWVDAPMDLTRVDIHAHIVDGGQSSKVFCKVFTS